jgi:hypothetical protein
MGYHQLRNLVHGEGNGYALCRARRRLAVRQDWVLDEGLLGDDRVRSDCCVHGFAVAEASGSTDGGRLGAGSVEYKAGSADPSASGVGESKEETALRGRVGSHALGVGASPHDWFFGGCVRVDFELADQGAQPSRHFYQFL